jgi:microcystin degradation protein MlrC
MFAQGGRTVVMAGFMHESNSFNPAKTTMADYGITDPSNQGEILARWQKSNTEVSGYVEGAKSAGFDLFPALFANATPKGPLTDQTFNTIMDRLIASIRKAPRVDGILLALHGAMVVESYPHGDEEIVRRVRKAFGDSIPVIVTHDYHANVSPGIVRASTVLITYKQNPHLDTKARGLQAAWLMGRILRGEVRPTQAIAKPPMVYNIIFQYTNQEPYKHITDETVRLESDPRFLAVSAPGGYQYGDCPYMGPSAVVCTNGDQALAEKEAKRIADMMWSTRDRIRLQLPDPAEAVRIARAETRFPVALFDTGDNIGGGSSGDSTFLLDELIAQKAEGWVVVIADREAVEAAKSAGLGGKFDMLVGGKTDSLHGKPIRVRGAVKSLHEGDYIETEIRHGGGRYHGLGHSAVIRVVGSTPDLENLLLVTTRRTSPNSIHQIVSCGIYPERQRILVAKGTIAPRAAYEPVAAKIIPVDSPGSTAVNPARFDYRHLRPGMWGIR